MLYDLFHRSNANGFGEDAVVSVVLDGVKTKSNAIPAFDKSLMNGIVNKSAPSATSRRISCGTRGSPIQSRGRSARGLGMIAS